MVSQTGKYIESLIDSGSYTQSDVAREIGAPRQLLNSVVLGKRDLSLPLALKLESFFSLPEGKLLKMQTEQTIRQRKLLLRNEIAARLIKNNAFWSYANVSSGDIPDEELIEKCFTLLDIDDIAKLFELYSRTFIKRVWRERMAIQGDYLLDLNVMIALYYFGIKNPERYLAAIEREHINKLTKYA